METQLSIKKVEKRLFTVIYNILFMCDNTIGII